MILYNLDFEDAYLDINNKLLSLKKNGKLFKTINLNNNDFEDFKKEGFFKEKNSFSIKKIINNQKVFFRIARPTNFLVIRKLGFTFDFYKVYRLDPVMLDFVLSILLNKNNNSLLISGLTGSGKTTFLLSLLEYLNNYTTDKIKIGLFKELLNKFLKEKNNNIILSDDYQELQKVYNENLNSQEQKKFLNVIQSIFEGTKLIEFTEKYNNKVVYTIEKPIEYLFENNNLLFIQNEVEGDDINNYVRFVDVALQSNPDFVYISEIKNKTEYEKFLDVIFVGPIVIGSNHAANVFQNLKRLESVTDNLKEIKNKITMGMGGLINFKRYNTINLTNEDRLYLNSYELLKFEEEVINNYQLNNFEVFQSFILKERHNDGYYFSHNVSLLYNAFLLYKKGYSFIIKEKTKKELFNDIINNNDILTKHYKLDVNNINFLQDKITESYKLYKEKFL